ncbi:RNA degradosome polyphosphate kinase [Anaerococcus porci]|uniref:RNA degradosome polyphosphate kinase n=1 Tax=Anaerococcus porci TaxID=2652269 RepID=UPI002A757599|nr:RNA degradosome polyphosphate kinase [Anaerococcus porci]MDY3006065.1 RNA degradosome polyphosphate kinase [Anaerococcus porci]
MDISFTQNRELSWLKFNERVLDEADDKEVELFERLKFYSIFDTNLEEFFMVRVGSLEDLTRLKKKAVDNKSNMTPEKQLEAIMIECKRLYQKKDEVYKRIINDFKSEGIFISKVSDLDKKDYDTARFYFDSKIEPILNFQVVDRVRPFPRLPNLSINVIFNLVKERLNKKDRNYFGIIYVPDKIDRYLKVSQTSIVLLEDIIKEFGENVFDNYKCQSKHIMSVTRNADISYDDDDYDVDLDYRSYMKDVLKRRKRLQPVRLELDEQIEEEVFNLLLEKLSLKKESVFITSSPMRAGFIYDMLEDMPQSLIDKCSYNRFSPQESFMVDKNRPMIDQIDEKDILLSYPYESMDSVIRLLNEASEDESVISIKITLYRIAKDSEIAKALIRAAENGKEVFVLMELRARFDENNNIIWSSRLENAGCKIVYGFDDYKCHSKVCLITRVKNDKINYTSQVATGNYNEKTAKLYTDFSFMTSNKEIGIDVKEVFDNIMIGNLEGNYKHLLVSPKPMQERLDELINEQIKRQKETKDGYIRLKMNSISDRKLIDKLSEASNEGVKIDLLIRGITCILPGIKNRTENVNVHQIVGRFLEHHRVYQFGKSDNCKLFISSADFMTRNIRNRMEVACPIYQKDIKKRILEFMDIMFADDVKTRMMNSKGEYKKVEKKIGLIAQEKFIEISIKRAREKNKVKESRIIPNNINHNKFKNSKNKKNNFFDRFKHLFK